MKNMTMKFMALALFVVAGSASLFAQGVTFDTGSLPRGMRRTGVTEVAGDFTLTPKGIANGTVGANSNITLKYSAPITSTISNANVLCAVCGANITVTLQGTDTVGILFTADVLFSPAAGDTITVRGVRVNASTSSVASVSATVSGTSTGLFPLAFDNQTRVVGELQDVISASVTAAANPILTCAPSTQSFTVKITELFVAALTSLQDEINASNLPAPNNGVQVRYTILNVPAGMTVSTPAVTVTNGTLSLNLNGGAASQSVAQTTANTPITFTFSVFNGVAGYVTAVGAIENVTVTFSVAPTAAGALPAVTNPINVQAQVELIPITTSTSTTIVRFVSDIKGPSNALTISDCTTRLLMTWAATTAPFETGVAIANTSNDDAAFGAGAANGATAQSGTCTLTGYPSSGGTPVSFTTTSIAAGATLPFLLSQTTGFANFTGHILAVCNFQTAHAFTFITDGRGTVTGPGLAQGYLANTIPGGTRAGGGGTESLGN